MNYESADQQSLQDGFAFYDNQGESFVQAIRIAYSEYRNGDCERRELGQKWRREGRNDFGADRGGMILVPLSSGDCIKSNE